MQQRNFIEEIKYQFLHGGMTIKLIMVNVAIFLIVGILIVFDRLIGGSQGFISSFLFDLFALRTDFWGAITHPWAFFTSIFAHFTIMHLLVNMLFLYFSGRMFEQIFDQKRLLYTYLIGGVVGSIFEILAHAFFPIFQNQSITIVGASGSVMAIFVALAFHKPNLEVFLFGLFRIRLIFLALFFVLYDFLSLGINDGTAHFAHLGGAFLGMLSVQNLYSSNNIVSIVQKWGDSLLRFFSRSEGPRMKVKKGSGSRTQQFKSDEQYNQEAKVKQAKTDKILDKISKSGYESLTKEEKDFLFNQSKNG